MASWWEFAAGSISAGEEAVSMRRTPSSTAEDFRAVDGEGRGLSLLFQRW